MTNDELPASVTENAAKWPESTCVECGRKMPPGRTQHCKLTAGGLCSWRIPAALGRFMAAPIEPKRVRTYSEAEEVADSLKYIEKTAHNAGVTKTYAALSGEFQKVTEKAAEPTCGVCHQPIVPSRVLDSGWRHKDIYASATLPCYGKAAPAAPPVVISSPAHFLPELKSDADHFAEEYMAEMNAAGKGIPAWLQPHLAWMFLMGAQMERLKGGK